MAKTPRGIEEKVKLQKGVLLSQQGMAEACIGCTFYALRIEVYTSMGLCDLGGHVRKKQTLKKISTL